MSKKPERFVRLSGEAVAALRKKLALSKAELMRLTGLSRNTLALLEAGRTSAMLKVNAQELAAALKVPLTHILRDESVEPILKNPILGYMGLKEVPVAQPDNVPLIKWSMTSTNQPMAYSWPAPVGDKIEVEIVERHECLRFWFDGKHGSLPINFGCTPLDHTPRKLSAFQTAIGFGTLVSEGDKLAIGVRVTDGKGREWVYADDAPYSSHAPMHQMELKSGPWNPCIVNLLAPPERWYLFRVTSADRIRNLRPEFSTVSRLVIEIGSGNPGGRPGAARGELYFSSMWLGTPETLKKRIGKLDSLSLTQLRKAINK